MCGAGFSGLIVLRTRRNKVSDRYGIKAADLVSDGNVRTGTSLKAKS